MTLHKFMGLKSKTFLGFFIFGMRVMEVVFMDFGTILEFKAKEPQQSHLPPQHAKKTYTK